MRITKSYYLTFSDRGPNRGYQQHWYFGSERGMKAKCKYIFAQNKTLTIVFVEDLMTHIELFTFKRKQLKLKYFKT